MVTQEFTDAVSQLDRLQIEGPSSLSRGVRIAFIFTSAFRDENLVFGETI